MLEADLKNFFSSLSHETRRSGVGRSGSRRWKPRRGERLTDRRAYFYLVLNLQTAKALGLTIPQSILARADEVIE